MMLFSGTIHPALGARDRRQPRDPGEPSELRRFASGEIYFRAEESVRGADVFVVQSHYEPGERGDHGAADHDRRDEARVAPSASRAVIPYYGYSRQDHKALSREPISAKLVADLLSTAGADRVVSVDLHSRPDPGVLRLPVRPPHRAADPVGLPEGRARAARRRPRRRRARRRPDQDRGEAPRVPPRGPGVPLQAPLAQGGPQDRGDGGGR